VPDCEKTGEKKLITASAATRFLYMVVHYMAAGLNKMGVAQRNGLYFTLNAFIVSFYGDIG
jgi:hypothetical protein